MRNYELISIENLARVLRRDRLEKNAVLSPSPLERESRTKAEIRHVVTCDPPHRHLCVRVHRSQILPITPH